MHEVCHEERHGEICFTTRNGCTAFYGAFGSAPFRVVKQISLRPVTRIPILVPESLLDFCKGALFVVPPVSSFRQILAPRTPQMKKQPVHSQVPAFTSGFRERHAVVGAALVDTADGAVAVDTRIRVAGPAGDVRRLLRLCPVVAVAAQTPAARGGRAERSERTARNRSEALEARSAGRAVGRRQSAAGGRRPDAGASAPAENGQNGDKQEGKEDVRQPRHRVGARPEHVTRRGSKRAGGEGK